MLILYANPDKFATARCSEGRCCQYLVVVAQAKKYCRKVRCIFCLRPAHGGLIVSRSDKSVYVPVLSVKDLTVAEYLAIMTAKGYIFVRVNTSSGVAALNIAATAGEIFGHTV